MIKSFITGTKKPVKFIFQNIKIRDEVVKLYGSDKLQEVPSRQLQA